ncbi:MAG: phytanoyl-CoA dioxygenase family protein [bacterium]|nr:phytanoyl-CoA dioxygenase family protein [bacterium]
MPGLSDEQILFFKEQGYLLVEDVISAVDFQPLINELNETVDRNIQEMYAAGLLEDLFENEPFERRLARAVKSVQDASSASFGDPLFKGLTGKLKTEGMFAVVTHPGILDIVESLIGPEILAHPQFNIRPKLPNQDVSVVPWHQDLGYLEPDATETFMVNSWIPLVDATVENGCMEVIAESHRMPLIEHVHKLGPAGNFKGIVDEALPGGEQVACPVRKGSVLLIQHKTIHRSIPNLSDHIRWSLDLRYSDPAMPTGRESVPGFIACSQKHPASVTDSLQGWLDIMAATETA